MALITKSIGTTGRDYSTITAWEAALGGAAGGAGNDALGEGYNDSVFDENVTINDATPDSVVLSVASGERHDGTAGSGCRNVRTGAGPALNLVCPSSRDNLLTAQWWEIDMGGNAGPAVQTTSSSFTNVPILRNCIVHDQAGGNSLSGFINSSSRDCLVMNNIFYDCNRESASVECKGLNLDSDRTSGGCFNNTVYNVTNSLAGGATGIKILTNSANGTCKNNISMGNTTNDFTFGGTSTDSDYNMSSDDTADDGGGSNNLINKTTADQFVSTTGGSEDLHLKTGADAIGAGVDLGTTPTNVNIDIDGRDRDSEGDTWDIGPDQSVPTGTTGTGDITIGNTQLDADGTVGRDASGNITVGNTQLDADGVIGRDAQGNITVGQVQASGSGSVSGNITGSGDITIGNVDADGSGTVGRIGSGDLTIGHIQASGVGEVEKPGTGAITIGQVQVSGSGTIGRDAQGNITIGNVSVDGAGSVGGAVSGSGDITVGNVRLNGSGTRKISGSGNITISLTLVSGTAEREITGTGDITIGNPQVDGSGSVGNDGQGNLTVGAVQVDGAGTVGRVGTGDITIGNVQADGDGTLGRTGSGDITIGNISVNGTGAAGSIVSGTGAITIGNVQASGDEATQTPIIIRIINKIKGLMPNMTQANGYSLDYSAIDVYDPDTVTYPAVYLDYSEEIASVEEVVEWESVDTTLNIRVVLGSTADLDKSAHYVAADFGMFLENYRNSLMNQGLISFDLLRSVAEYRHVNDYAVEVTLEVNLKYRRQLSSPFTVDFSVTNDSPSGSAFDSNDKPVAIAIIDQIKTQIAAMTEANGYTMDYGSVNVLDPDSKTYPTTELHHTEENYLDQDMVNYYEAETPVRFDVTCDNTAQLDLISRQVVSDFTKMFRDNFATLQTKGLSRFEYQQAEFSYKMVRDYAVMVSFTYSLFYRRQMSSPYTT